MANPIMEAVPFVAVIVPVYNDPGGLRLCLKALEQQNYPKDRYRILVVDNGPSEAIHRVCSTFSNVTYLEEHKRGSYAARNTAILHADFAEIAAFTDADCIPRSDWLANGVSSLRSGNGPDLIGGRVEIFPQDRGNITSAELYEGVTAFPQQRYVECGGWSVTANLLTRLSVFANVGLFDGDLKSGGDREWCKRATGAGMKIVYAEDVVVAHPARATLVALRKKHERVIAGGGARMARQKRSFPRFARKLLREILYGTRQSREVVALTGLTGAEKVKVVTVVWYIKYVRIRKLVLLRTGFSKQDP